MGVSKDLVSRSLDAVQAGDGNDALDLLREWVTALGGEEEPEPPTADPATFDDLESVEEPRYSDPGGEDDGADGVAPPKKLTAQQRKLCKAYGIREADYLKVQRAHCGTKPARNDD